MGTSGLVQIRPTLTEAWASVEKTPLLVPPGAALRSGRQASAYVKLGAHGTVLLQEETVFTLEELKPERALSRLEIGVAAFRFVPGARAQVRTPAAALSGRAAEFRLTVLAGGRTTVELSEGELGVEDNRGHQLLLRAGESVRVDLRGLEIPRRMPAAGVLRREGLREAIRREAAADAFRERLYAGAADSLRRSQWEEGRALVDSSGARVRAESWVRRPRADQLELVVLNGRPGRLDWFYHLGTYSAAVPADPAPALRALAGTAGSPPGLTLTAYESARSNGTDVVLESGDGGHLVDLNSNADGLDDVSSVFDPVTGAFAGASGRSAWRSLFDRWGLYVNGRLAEGGTGTNIQAESERTPTTTNDPFSGAALTASNALLSGGMLAGRSESVTHPAPGRQLVSSTWSEGSTLSVASAALEEAAARPASLPASGGAAAFRAVLPGAWLEQAVSGSLLGGRDIRLALDPALGMAAGLVP